MRSLIFAACRQSEVIRPAELQRPGVLVFEKWAPSSCIEFDSLHTILLQGRSLCFSCCLNVIWQMDSICRRSGGLTLLLTLFLFFFFLWPSLACTSDVFKGGEICIELTLSSGGLPAPCPCLFGNQSFVILVLQPKPKLDSMASAITCNFPTWCASFHRCDGEHWETCAPAPPRPSSHPPV